MFEIRPTSTASSHATCFASPTRIHRDRSSGPKLPAGQPHYVVLTKLSRKMEISLETDATKDVPARLRRRFAEVVRDMCASSQRHQIHANSHAALML